MLGPWSGQVNELADRLTTERPALRVSTDCYASGSAQGSSYVRTGGDTMIKKVKGGYKVLSENGKNMGGPYKSKAQAEKRLRQVEFFKHRKG